LHKHSLRGLSMQGVDHDSDRIIYLFYLIWSTHTWQRNI